MLTTYEWEGERHQTSSIKKVNGVEVARNIIRNGTFALDNWGWRVQGGSEQSISDGVMTVVSGSEYWQSIDKPDSDVTIIFRAKGDSTRIRWGGAAATSVVTDLTGDYQWYSLVLTPQGNTNVILAGDASFTHVALIPGIYDGPYFDGDTPSHFDEAAPGGGWHVTHEWAGEPHNSASIKKVNGVEVARNLSENPHFVNTNARIMNGINPPYGDNSVTDSIFTHEITQATASNRFQKVFRLEEAGTYTYTFLANFSDDVADITSLEWRQAVGVTYEGQTVREVLDGWGEYSVTFHASEPGEKTIRLYTRGESVGDKWHVDWELLTPGTVTDYFDGDTPDYIIPESKIFYDGKWVSVT